MLLHWMLFRRESKAATAPVKGQDCPGVLGPGSQETMLPVSTGAYGHQERKSGNSPKKMNFPRGRRRRNYNPIDECCSPSRLQKLKGRAEVCRRWANRKTGTQLTSQTVLFGE